MCILVDGYVGGGIICGIMGGYGIWGVGMICD